ncbi:roadblock/LC7 domain-containing protein [Geobacter hydrogenophilus]|uniref:GTPase n=1 Tax=Geobacter hydrogenophilus TaxID=40983 RepID=A0A9W6LC29_9BACT|nr:roadblock/LC7 domain-containing protein [Geobacter hydrogenophilus]MBT0894978.1 roadblock/LC7 domain-containing protein [Geobacter hydrogenophilus]GLI37051.1 GTPase [Geobacter hydrogenophilus]
MPFSETLKSIVESVEGGLGAIIMADDGIAIDEYFLDGAGMDLNLMAVEYASLLKEVKRTADVLKTGMLEELAVNTGQSRVIVRIINDELFIALILGRDGNYGKGRYLLRREVSGLRERLS